MIFVIISFGQFRWKTRHSCTIYLCTVEYFCFEHNILSMVYYTVVWHHALNDERHSLAILQCERKVDFPIDGCSYFERFFFHPSLSRTFQKICQCKNFRHCRQWFLINTSIMSYLLSHSNIRHCVWDELFY